MKKSKNQKSKILKGFTLIELLVSSAIFITVGVIIISALFVTFRVSRKTEIMRSLRQNGDNALTQMVNQIRYAKNLDDPISCTTPIEQPDIAITSSFDGGQTIYSCPTDDSPSLSSNSASLIDANRYSVQACSFSCFQASIHQNPTITIRFTLFPALLTDFSETESSVSFQTSVTMRNYGQ